MRLEGNFSRVGTGRLDVLKLARLRGCEAHYLAQWKLLTVEQPKVNNV